MRFEGLLKTWNDERGFGFIQPAIAGQEIFVHIKSFPAGFGRPAPGLKITFEVEQGTDGKKRAKNVMLVSPVRTGSGTAFRAPAQWEKSGVYALCAFALLYFLVSVIWGTRPFLAIGYVITSLTCWLFYANDKAAAEDGKWRTSEGTLLMLGLIGGWPGAIVAQQMLRHKTSKVTFRVAFWATVVLNVAAFIAYTSPFLRAANG